MNVRRTAHFFTENRKRLATRASDGIVVLAGYTAMQRTNDAAFRYEQEASFWYLTGIEAPDWWLIMSGGGAKTMLVMPEVDDVHQVFDGSLSAKRATEISGIVDVITRARATELLRELAESHQVAYTLGADPHAEHYDFSLNPAPLDMKQRLQEAFSEVKDCRVMLAEQRALKHPEELALMQQAIDVTIEAFEIVKERLPQLRYEYEIEAEFSYHFRRSGAQGHAYDPIVACGSNACTLHYVDNNSLLREAEFVVLDIGARVDGYAADITRTYAIGAPTERQRAVHRAVQLAQREIILLLGPGVSVKKYHQQVDVIMKHALVKLKLMQSMDDETAYRRYFPHSISHGLGIDVHDSLGGPDVFAPGMVLTVEPGIYIPEESMGVRIEDDILITTTGYQNLSGALSTDW